MNITFEICQWYESNIIKLRYKSQVLIHWGISFHTELAHVTCHFDHLRSKVENRQNIKTCIRPIGRICQSS